MGAKEENGQNPPAQESGEKILSRWSRLKQEANKQPVTGPPPVPASNPEAPAPELPAVDQLGIDSDFRGFFHPKVDESLRRAALKKLFSDPHFNVMDGLDVYIDDYSKSDPLPAAMLAGLKQAQNIIAWAKEGTEDAEAKTAAPAASAPQTLTDEAALLAAAADLPPAAQPQDTEQRIESLTADTRKS